ncbi:uncharacterized protein THITE_114649 [Thermothielavioides terrestris NRRL 8126]|uniref:Uncharacterized protein n=1 Tax=Thermothielavioides terrestris (strain ATCC 38088 / NRRL 8126) TaxID=578455 RepID=G2RCT2_THETT|nr:uncharacterized protein THITE_114649 [Thermothielavioides terrestris NRRL 8126]AEO70678.1 hypothetical protein THITE_114649 [Thermothielavioides terrestris NRRL 8126]
MGNFATGVVQSAPSPTQEEAWLEAVKPAIRDYRQDDWGYSTGPNSTGHLAVEEPYGMWQETGTLPLTSSYDVPMFDVNSDGTVWPAYGELRTHRSQDFGSYAPAWPMSPSETLSTNPWSQTDQPLPSPLSEAPSLAFSASPLTEDGRNGEQYSSPYPSQLSASQPRSPSGTRASSTVDTPVVDSKGKAKPKPKSKKSTRPSKNLAKKPTAEPTPRPDSVSRPQTLKRHWSDTSAAAMTVAMPTAHPSAPPPPPPPPPPTPPAARITTTIATTTTTIKTTLGGVLPANVDPREAAEQIQREAWQRCRAEARAMSQRRMLLLGRERGALRRESQRLQANLGRMREAVARGGGDGLGGWSGDGGEEDGQEEAEGEGCEEGEGEEEGRSPSLIAAMLDRFCQNAPGNGGINWTPRNSG